MDDWYRIIQDEMIIVKDTRIFNEDVMEVSVMKKDIPADWTTKPKRWKYFSGKGAWIWHYFNAKLFQRFHADVIKSAASVKLVRKQVRSLYLTRCRPLEIEQYDWTATCLLSLDQSFSLADLNFLV